MIGLIELNDESRALTDQLSSVAVDLGDVCKSIGALEDSGINDPYLQAILMKEFRDLAQEQSRVHEALQLHRL